MICVISIVLLLVIMPAAVTALEYNHYWTKLYDWFASIWNSCFSKKLSILHYKDGPNSTHHQVMTYVKWLLIGLVAFGVIMVLHTVL